MVRAKLKYFISNTINCTIVCYSVRNGPIFQCCRKIHLIRLVKLINQMKTLVKIKIYIVQFPQNPEAILNSKIKFK